jgi:AcrR family transcriptional regulator
MAQIQKESVKERIFEAAQDIFYEKGYKDTTMREVAERAEIPVGLIYTYYKNKADILDAIVEPIFTHISTMMSFPCGDDSEADKKAIQNMLVKLLNFRKAMSIALYKSGGTKYENSRDEVIKMVASHIAAERPRFVDGYEDFHATIIAVCYVESITQIIENYENNEWAERMIGFLINTFMPQY